MPSTPHRLIAAVFNDPEKAKRIVEQLVDHDFPMDQVSLLHRAGGHGDDILGISYKDDAERFRVWGEHGALWGALGGLLAGASGMLIVPGIGPLMAAGPLLDLIVGATLGAGLMTGAAAVTRLGAALRKLNIPDEKLEALHDAVMAGKTLLIVHCDRQDPSSWKQRLQWQGAESVWVLP